MEHLNKKKQHSAIQVVLGALSAIHTLSTVFDSSWPSIPTYLTCSILYRCDKFTALSTHLVSDPRSTTPRDGGPATEIGRWMLARILFGSTASICGQVWEPSTSPSDQTRWVTQQS